MRPPISAFVLLLACRPESKPGDSPADSASPVQPDSGVDAPDASALQQLVDLGPMNVIVIHADTLRADHLPMYGYARDTTPGLEEHPHVLVYGDHATTSWTLPSTSSALLGVSPERHGRVLVGLPSDQRGLSTIGVRFKEAGYNTGMFSGNRMMTSDSLLSDGFDMHLGPEDLDDVESQAMDTLGTQASEWVSSLDPATPFLVWLQPMDVHVPYRPKDPFKGTWADYDTLPFDASATWEEQAAGFGAAWDAAETEEERDAIVANVRAVYDEMILQQHDAVEGLLDWLESTGRAEDTLVVLSSDHGETIGDDLLPSISHGGTLRPELVQIPLIFFNPQLESAGATCLSSNPDLLPTLMRAVGLPDPDNIEGSALQDRCREAVVSSLYQGDSSLATLLELSATDGRYKLELSCPEGELRLFDLAQDPGALDPLDPAEVAGLEKLEQALAETLAAAQDREPTETCSYTLGRGR